VTREDEMYKMAELLQRMRPRKAQIFAYNSAERFVEVEGTEKDKVALRPLLKRHQQLYGYLNRKEIFMEAYAALNCAETPWLRFRVLCLYEPFPAEHLLVEEAELGLWERHSEWQYNRLKELLR